MCSAAHAIPGPSRRVPHPGIGFRITSYRAFSLSSQRQGGLWRRGERPVMCSPWASLVLTLSPPKAPRPQPASLLLNLSRDNWGPALVQQPCHLIGCPQLHAPRTSSAPSEPLDEREKTGGRGRGARLGLEQRCPEESHSKPHMPSRGPLGATTFLKEARPSNYIEIHFDDLSVFSLSYISTVLLIQQVIHMKFITEILSGVLSLQDPLCISRS